MGIISGSLQTLKGITYGPSLLNSGGGRGYFCPFAVAYQVNTSPNWSRISSAPSGYGWKGYFEALKAGGIAARSAGVSISLTDIKGIAEITTPTNGTSSSAAPVREATTFSISANGVASLSSNLRGIAEIRPSVVIGAQPSALEIADAVWQRASSAFTSSGTMAQEVKQAKTGADQALKTGQFLALKDV